MNDFSKTGTIAPKGAARVLRKLAAGANGTKGFTERYGDSLVCVRYWEDAERGVRYTTVELVVSERSIIGGPVSDDGHRRSRMVLVKISYREKDLRGRVKSAGAKWDAQAQAWSMPLSVARQFGLLKRVVQEGA